ncbi:transcriptional regulation of mitochondrial recombination-domain-containing protein [Phyllosticta capitalensis]
MSGLGTQAARGIEASKDAARQVFVYCNFRTNQTLYSLNERVLRHSHLKQLHYAGKKTLPAKLRKDVWRPLAVVTLPFEKQARDAYQKLVDFKKLHELYWDQNEAKDWGVLPEEKQKELVGRKVMPNKKERAKIIMDQKANSIADIAKVMELQTASASKQFDTFMAKDDQVEDLFWLRSLFRNLLRLGKTGQDESLRNLLNSTDKIDENANSGLQRLRLAITLLKRHRILSRPSDNIEETINQLRSEYTPIREQLRDRQFAYLDSLRQERELYEEVRELRKQLGIAGALLGNVHREQQQWTKYLHKMKEEERREEKKWLKQAEKTAEEGGTVEKFPGNEEARQAALERSKIGKVIHDFNWKVASLESKLAEKKRILEETNEAILEALYPASQKPSGALPKKGPLHQKAMLRQSRPRPFTLNGVEIRWSNMVDLEHAEEWPELIFHEGLAVERYKPNMSRVVIDKSMLPDVLEYAAGIPREREQWEREQQEKQQQEAELLAQQEAESQEAKDTNAEDDKAEGQRRAA